MSTSPLIVLAGGGETTYDNVAGLLENWLKIDVNKPITATAYDFLLPVGRDHNSETVGIYADWLMDLDVAYAVVTDREVPEDLEDVVAGASHVFDVGTGNISNWVINHLRDAERLKQEAHLILSWGPDSEKAPDAGTEALLAGGMDAGVSMKDVSMGLEDFVLGEASEPTPEPEPEPEPDKPKRTRRSAKAKAEEAEEAEPAKPAPVVNPKPEPDAADELAPVMAAAARTRKPVPHVVEANVITVEWKPELGQPAVMTTLRRVETFLSQMDSVFASEPVGKLLAQVRETIRHEQTMATLAPAQQADAPPVAPLLAQPASEPEEAAEAPRRGRPRKPPAEAQIGVLINDEAGTVRRAARGKPRNGERAAKMTMAEVTAQFGEQDWS